MIYATGFSAGCRLGKSILADGHLPELTLDIPEDWEQRRELVAGIAAGLNHAYGHLPNQLAFLKKSRLDAGQADC